MQLTLLDRREKGEDAYDPCPTRNAAFARSVVAGFLTSLLLLGCVAWSPLPSSSTQLVEITSAPAADLDNTTLAMTHIGRLPIAHSLFPSFRSKVHASRFPFPASRPPFLVSRSPTIFRANADDQSHLVDLQPLVQENGSKVTFALESEVVAGERTELKRTLLRLCASYDRGFGASSKARKEVDEIVERLKDINPTPTTAARGIGGESNSPDHDPPPLKGIWRMVWTTALDVLSLGASPVALPGAIYQVIEPPVATNIIDFIPRAQALLPRSFPSTLVRAEVKTRVSPRADTFNRVGLSFEALKLIPVEVLGTKADFLPPLTANFNLPQILNLQNVPGFDPDTSPGYFDVRYLDEEILIIQQNAPGGYFVLLNVPNSDP